MNGKKDNAGDWLSVVRCRAKFRLADSFKGRFIETVPSAFFYGCAQKPSVRVNIQFNDYLPFNSSAPRQSRIARRWRLNEFGSVYSIE